jgi:peptidoglycan/LPS O-acetylase OafA/YrhL
MHHKHPHLAHPRYRPDIDGLRAVAILSVVMFHAFPHKMPGGFIGVDIFFVISGFLISTIIFSSLERDRFSLFEFYVRRVRRIFPALLLLLVACLALGWLVLFPSDYNQLAKQAAAGAGFVVNFMLWKDGTSFGGYFDNDAGTKPLLHLWSLAIEEQFYIFWPLLLAFIWKRQWSFLKITIAIGIFSFAANIYWTEHQPIGAFFLPFSRFWELMVGGCLAYIALHRPELVKKYEAIQSAMGFTAIFLALLLLDKGRDFPGWWDLLPTLGAFLIISAGPSAWLNQKLLANKLMVWVGLISYPLYLWHWPLLAFLKITQGDLSFLQRLGIVIISIGLAFITYRFVETPLRFGPNQRLKALLLLLSITAICVLSTLIYTSDGRLGKPFHTVENDPTKYDYTSAYRMYECFLDGIQPDSYARVCDGNQPDEPTVVLWGDSHGASYYRAFLQLSIRFRFNLAQYNTSGCPPILSFEVDARKYCKSLNDYVLNKIRDNRPAMVVLAANWLLYDGKSEDKNTGKVWNALSQEKLSETIITLRALGVKRIVLIGQLPTYTMSQVSIGQQKFVSNKMDRTYFGYIQDSTLTDNKMRQFAKDNNVYFVSPVENLCNKAGCLISTRPDKLVPLAWDTAHLTTAGAIYLINAAIPKTLFEFSGTPDAR